MLSTLRFVHVFALAVFLGGGVLLFAAVAPGAFASLPTPALAGRVVAHALRFLDTFVLVATPVLLAIAVFDERARGSTTRLRVVRGALLVFPFVAAAVSRFVLVPKMDALRALPSYPGSEAAPWLGRADFGMLHGVASSLALAALLAAAAALYLAVRARPASRDLS